MDGDNEVIKYCTYNGLARSALVFGIPIPALIACLLLALVTGFLGFSILGLKGLVFPVLVLGVIFVLRIKCQKDSRALEVLKWDFLGLLIRVINKSKVISFGSIEPNGKRRKKDVAEWFKNNPDFK